MKRVLYILALFALGFYACSKDQPEAEKTYPEEVAFVYGGETVTCQVIKKTYTRDSAGNPLSEPVTKLWLDRNLGATRAAVAYNDSMASGDLCQWGRLADGHQKRDSDTTEQLSAGIVPGHDHFIASPLISDDWLVVSDDSLWNGSDNTNCSCPEGWRVPTAGELAMEMNSWTPQNMDGAYASTLKWVASGNRDNHGTERYSEYWSFIWSSTPATHQDAYVLAIPGSLPAEIISSGRIYGLVVRCIRDY